MKKGRLKLRLRQYQRTFLNTLWKDNPVCRMVLGICSTLAVTNRLDNAFAMGIGVTFTLVLSSGSISLVKDIIPRRVRMIIYMAVIATLVIIVDRILKAYFPELSTAMGPYVGLIITNCIIMGRVESFAALNRPVISIIDALGAGLGYTISLLIIAFVREILGFGSLFGVNVMGPHWKGWIIMIMAPGAFLVLAVYIWVIRSIQKAYDERP